MLRRVFLTPLQALSKLTGRFECYLNRCCSSSASEVCLSKHIPPPPPSFLSCRKRVFSAVKVLLSKGNPCFCARHHCWLLFQLEGSILHDLHPISSSTGGFLGVLIALYICRVSQTQIRRHIPPLPTAQKASQR